MEMLRFNWKTVLQFFETGIYFAENLFQSWIIENIQIFQWLSNKNMMNHLFQTSILFNVWQWNV